MKTEIEVKFVNIQHDEMRKKLEAVGAVCVAPMRMMRRVTFDSPVMKAKNGWIRIRDEGDKVTLAYKQIDKLTIDGVKEIETIVGDFDDTLAIFRQLDLMGGSYQESKRESWRLGDVQVELDEWPWLDPYIEIEAPTQDDIARTAKLLGLDLAVAVAGDVMSAYRVQYPHLKDTDTVGNLAEVKFGTPIPDMLRVIS